MKVDAGGSGGSGHNPTRAAFDGLPLGTIVRLITADGRVEGEYRGTTGADVAVIVGSQTRTIAMVDVERILIPLDPTEPPE